MSIYDRQESLDLFAAEMIKEEVLKDSVQETNEELSVLKIDYGKIERTVIFNDSFNELKYQSGTKHFKSKSDFLKSLSAGDVIYIDGFSTRKFKINAVEDDMYLGKHLNFNKGGYFEPLTDKMWAQHVDIVGEIIAIEKQGIPYFFNYNPDKQVELVTTGRFERYINGLNTEERDALIVFSVYFNKRIIPLTALESKNPALEFKESGDRYFSKPNIGYWEKRFNVNKDYTRNEYLIDYFGDQYCITQKQLDDMYWKVIAKLAQVENGSLSNLNDFELMAYYAFLGYRVIPNFITFEWTLRHTNSEKVMFIDRADLNDVNIAIAKWLQFSTNHSCEYQIPLLKREENDLASNYLSSEGIELKPFIIPTGTLYRLQDKYQKVTGHLVYKVLKDDGKFVTLQPVEKSSEVYKECTTAPQLQLPRKEFQWAYIKAEDYGLGEHNNEDYQYIAVPFAIPTTMESTIEQLIQNHQSFIMRMSETEYEKFLVYDRLIGSRKLTQAMLEKDYNLANKIISSRLKDTTSDYLDMIGGSLRGVNQYYQGNSILGKMFNRLPKTPLSNMTMDGTIIFQPQNIFDLYVGMFEAVEKLSTKELTIVELMLAYTIKHRQLRYFGTPTHFQIAENCVHTTKYDLLNMEETIQKLFF